MSTANPLEIGPQWRTKLLPQIIDHRAEVTPDLLYAEYPISSTSYDRGFRKFTYGNLANAINGIAWWLQSSLGPGKFETLAYIGPNDIRIPALILGAVKAGYVIFLTSPRNSVPAQLHLLAQTKCKTLITSTPQSPAATAIFKSSDHKLRHLEVPTVEQLIEEVYTHFPYKNNVHSEPLCIVHTSGSTGMPKTIVLSHAAAMGNSDLMGKDPPQGFDNICRYWQGNRVFAVFPPFHAMYLGAFLFNAVIFGTVMISPVAAAIPTAAGLVDALKQTFFDTAFILPSIVRELSHDSSLLDYCVKNLKRIFFAGGDLPQDVGNVVASKIKLLNHYGSTESGLLTLLAPTNDIDGSKRDWKDWKYLQLHNNLGCEFRQYNDEEFELYIVRDAKLAKYQPVFRLFPDALEYRTRDLFLRHPTKKDLWKWCARADDIIVLLTGEKTNPISMEQSILYQNPSILGLLVVGAQRFQTALLIHPAQELLTVSEKAAFIEKIWPSIEEANQVCPTHARIAKSHVLFTTPSKPMLFSGKGTIQRAATLNLYASELDKLYEDADKISGNTKGHKFLIDLSTENFHNVSDYTRRTISAITNWQDLGELDDFFLLGMDSLQALMAVRQFKQDLALPPSFSTSTIYTNPSVSALSTAIIDLSSSERSEDASRERVRNEIIEEYQHLIDQMPITVKVAKFSENKVVILTGSTGALGSYLLNALLEDPTVRHIYCLNRDASSARQLKRNQTSGLPLETPASRVTYLSANLSTPLLGLPTSTYNQMQDTVTHVIHNSWPVNFKLNVQAFYPQFAGLLNLVDFVATAKFHTNLMFISSISAIVDLNPTGYAESKRISEAILSYASECLSRAPVAHSLSIVRVGQIAGAVIYKGQWNVAEWFPSLILSSIHLGIIPNSLGALLGRVDWIPIDVLAKVLVELAFSANKNGRVGIFSPSNPQTTTYEKLLPLIISKISQLTGKSLLPVPAPEWIDKVRKDIEAVAGSDSEVKEDTLERLLRRNPAAKLLDFYGDTLDTHDEKVFISQKLDEFQLGITRTLMDLGVVREEWLSKWIGEWVAGTDIKGGK